MKRKFHVGKALLIMLFAVAAVSLVSLAVMYLWNNVLAEVVSVGTVTFWQAMGLFALAKILFGFGGGKGGGRGPAWWRRRMHNKMRSMSPEDRERFKEEMSRRMNFWHMDDDCCPPLKKNRENVNNNPSDASN